MLSLQLTKLHSVDLNLVAYALSIHNKEYDRIKTKV